VPLDPQFVRIARRHFNPYSPSSGTELVAPLLYSLARMLRPRTVVEFGSGYSTLFILRALADNARDADVESQHLLAKTHRTSVLERWVTDDAGPTADARAAADEWLGAGGVACGVDPAFYLRRHSPHLFSFESQSPDHEYARQMRHAVDVMGVQSIFTHLCGQGFRKDALPADALPMDLAWNDQDQFVEFFLEFWDHLNPAGGVMVFHNVPGESCWHEAVEAIRRQRAAHGDLEYLLLEEPHKLNQNGCAVLRRTTGYRPRFALSRPEHIVQTLRTLVAS